MMDAMMQQYQKVKKLLIILATKIGLLHLFAFAHGEKWKEEEIGSSGKCEEEEEEWQRE